MLYVKQIMTNTSLEAFFAHHPVFTVEEVDRFLAARRGGTPQNPQTRQALLGYYRQQGRLRHVRRSLYAVETPGQEAHAFSSSPFSSADPFLIAARLAPDAVLAYHTALQLHGFAHSLRQEQICLSQQKFVRPLRFAGILYRAVPPPAALPAAERMSLGVETLDRQGLTVRATGLERTLVDVLDRPALGGGWEEAWRSWEGVAVALDFAFLLRYVRLLESATTAAKLGYALEAGRERLAVPPVVLEELRALAPRQPHPAERGLRQGTRLIRPWNLLVPAASLDEPSTDASTDANWDQEEGWNREGHDQEGEEPKESNPQREHSKRNVKASPAQEAQA